MLEIATAGFMPVRIEIASLLEELRVLREELQCTTDCERVWRIIDDIEEVLEQIDGATASLRPQRRTPLG